jgi:threonine synthase
VKASVPIYRSTRGESPAVPFVDALFKGLAPDGGLYLPSWHPQLPVSWDKVDSLAELATQVFALYVNDGAPYSLFEDALDFPLPVTTLSRERYVLELFHGPTLAFKDVGARVMARLMEAAFRDFHRKLTVLVATSGDTGSAVADAFSGFDNIEVVVFYPKGLVSELQETQLVAARPGVRTFSVNGTFDDCQRLVKAAFAEPKLKGMSLTSANSINIGRLLPQVLYYLWGASQVTKLRGGTTEEVVVSVPGGNLGNLAGGILAARMGLKLRCFLAAHNDNDYFPEFLEGSRQPFDFKNTISTVSNAMDVGAPSNFERLHALFANGMTEAIWGVSIDDEATLERIRITDAEDGYTVCPHTAVALEAAERYRRCTKDLSPMLVLATAHPAKFPNALEEALQRPPPQSETLERLRFLPTHVEVLEPTNDALVGVLLQDCDR